MAEEDGTVQDALGVVERIGREAQAWSFFAAVRHVQAVRGRRPGIGASERIEQDVIHFAQEPRLGFTPVEILSFGPLDGARGPTYELRQSFFGFFGPNGPLPMHITEEVIAAARGEEHDTLLIDFCNLLQHRMTALLYRGWASANLAASRDLGAEDPFKRFVDALYGAAQPGFAGRTALPDDLRRHLAGHLSGGNRSAAAVKAVAETVIGSAVEVRTHEGEWLALPAEERSRLASRRRRPGVPAQLGIDTMLGGEAYSLETRITLVTAPLPLDTYRALLPPGRLAPVLRSAIRHVLGVTGAWTLRPVLRAQDVPECRLGSGVRLGWDTWMSARERVGGEDRISL